MFPGAGGSVIQQEARRTPAVAARRLIMMQKRSGNAVANGFTSRSLHC